MEEERIKSALEIAMERISAMPDLTAEEVAAQKQKQYAPAGEAIAVRYLRGLLDDDELPAELAHYPADQSPIVRRAALSFLANTLRLDEDPRKTERALNGIKRIDSQRHSGISKAADEFQGIIAEYEQEIQTKFPAIELSALSSLGISGSAVRCNPAENPHWLEERKKIRQSFEPMLERLRASLLGE